MLLLASVSTTECDRNDNRTVDGQYLYLAVMRGIAVELICCLNALAGTYVDVYVWLVSAGSSELLRLLDWAINSGRYVYLLDLRCMLDSSAQI
jgi:hypothetical protein